MEPPPAMWPKDINYLKNHVPSQIIDEMIGNGEIVLISTFGERVFYQSEYCIFIRDCYQRMNPLAECNEPYSVNPMARTVIDTMFSYFRHMREVLMDGNKAIAIEDSHESYLPYPVPITHSFAHHIEEKEKFPGLVEKMVQAGKWKLTD